MELSWEEYSKINRMCFGIAKRRSGWSKLSTVDDLAMDLWIKAIEILETTNEVNFSWIGRCLWNKVIDLCRADKRIADKQFAAEYIDPICQEADEVNPMEPVLVREDLDSGANIRDILDLFEEGSRERRYVELIALYTGSPRSGKGKIFDESRMELQVAMKLGYASDTSSGYRNLRNRVRLRIAESGLGLRFPEAVDAHIMMEKPKRRRQKPTEEPAIA